MSEKNEATQMTYAAAVALYDLIGKILVDLENSTQKERSLPFNVQYKLNKAAAQLTHDYDYVQEKRRSLIIENGEEKDGVYTITDEAKKAEVIQALQEIYNQVTAHTFLKLTEEEALVGLKDVNFTSQETMLFTSALVETAEPTTEAEAEVPAETPAAQVEEVKPEDC